MTVQPLYDEISDYADWVRLHDASLFELVQSLERRSGQQPSDLSAPLFSICISGKSVEAGRTTEVLRVFVEQSFGAWEAFAGGEGHFFDRVQVLPITDALNEVDQCRLALGRARGKYFLVLPPEVMPSSHALWLLAQAVSDSPAVVYTDSDSLRTNGDRIKPRFRTGWDPDLLFAGDPVGSVYVVRTDIARNAGGYRAQATLHAGLLDLLLRVAAICPQSLLRHVPAVLWHAVAEPDRAHISTYQAARAVVAEALEGQGVRALIEASPLLPTALVVHWPLPSPAPSVSIIVPVRDRADLLVRCTDGILSRTDYQVFELLIVDNGSTEPECLLLLADLAKKPCVRILTSPGAFNFSFLNNRAVAEATGDIVVFLNNDTDIINANWLTELVAQASRPEIGAVGAKLLYSDGRVQHCGLWMGPQVVGHQFRFADRCYPGPGGELAVCRTVLAVTGACLALRRTVFLEIGGFEEEHLQITFNDVDLCLRLGDYGYRVVCTPLVELYHLESTSRGLDDTPDKQAVAHREFASFRSSWDALLDGDTFYNPHLVFEWDRVTLKAPRVMRSTTTQFGGVALSAGGNAQELQTTSNILLDRAVMRTREARTRAEVLAREADELRSQLAAQAEQLAAAHSVTSDLEMAIMKLTEDRAGLEHALRQIVQSTTWRATWPLRRLVSSIQPKTRKRVAELISKFRSNQHQ